MNSELKVKNDNFNFFNDYYLKYNAFGNLNSNMKFLDNMISHLKFVDDVNFKNIIEINLVC